MEVLLQKSNKPDKKYMVTFTKGKPNLLSSGKELMIDGKIIHFGAKGYEHFTTHKNQDRKHRYILRHNKNENWENPLSPGFWARWLLWNKPTIIESIADIEGRFNLDIELV